ncbi:hypothetical protein [Polaromonas sp.]|uniref:hypothetical protein n=1 Tax=Polaromonas sp. TaxID=1869339 RepID=UPI0024875CEE|nr:hypothetical protein [Polaromonas sp.]MDI1341442.1 hypothetical protein [Polaromonas sp.]
MWNSLSERTEERKNKNQKIKKFQKAENENGAHFGPAQASWKWTPLSGEVVADF